MLKKHALLLGILTSLLLIFVATAHYPGGSQHDKNATGFDWRNNYLSNLFEENAVNGSPNASRPWAFSGVLFLCASFALFFIEFSNKIPSKGAARVIKYSGVSAMLFAFFAVTPLHDTVLTLASSLALLSMFYITVFVFKSKFHALKILSAASLLASYACNYIYFTRTYVDLLPLLQKIALLLTIIWILCLHYFTSFRDFQSISNSTTKVTVP